MYKIYVDGVLFYDSTLEEMQIESGTITKELNKAGSFKFAIYPDHPFYDSIKELKSIIEVHKDGVDAPIFRGRALIPESDFYKKKTYTCEGHFNFLLDSVMRAFSITGTPAFLFSKLIENHNSQVEENKRFMVGNITVNGASNTFGNTSAGKTQDVMKKQLLDVYGGYIVPRLSDGVWYLDYLSDFEEYGAQIIEFGENLTKFTRKDNYSEIVTALIPYGKDDITVASANKNKDIVTDATGVSLYGTIVDTVKFDDVTNAATLLDTTKQHLADLVKKQIVIELNAIDLSLLDKSIEPLRIGTYSRIISEPHYLDDWFLITKQTIDLTNPTKDSVVLGGTFESFTEKTTKAETTVKNISGSIGAVVEKADSVISKVEGISDVSSGYEDVSDASGSDGDMYIRMGSDDTDGGMIYVKKDGQWVWAVKGENGSGGGGSSAELTDHVENTNNPHEVTLSQVGLTSGIVAPDDANGKDGDVYLQIGGGENHTVIEYLESSGTQYIDTGFVPNKNTRVVAMLKCPPFLILLI